MSNADFLTLAINKTVKLLEQLAVENPTIIVGLSGGPDSVFLLHMLAACRTKKPITLIAAHLNHGWRDSATQDATLCEQLCTQLKITLIRKHAQELDYIPHNNGSLEAMGRDLRRFFFKQIIKTYPNAYIALGHHAQDQEETFFIRLARGSSLQGLCGMQQITQPYIRPLLSFDKKEIVEYLDNNKIAYAHDETNNSMNFLRNRIRHKLLPALQECDERFGIKITDTMHHLQEADDFMIFACNQAYATLIDTVTQQASLIYFKTLHPYLQKRVLLQLLIQHNAAFSPSDSFLLEIIKFLQTPHGGIHNLSPHWHLHKKQNFFWLCQNSCSKKSIF